MKKNIDKKNGKYFKDFLRSDAKKVVTTVFNPKLYISIKTILYKLDTSFLKKKNKKKE